MHTAASGFEEVLVVLTEGVRVGWGLERASHDSAEREGEQTVCGRHPWVAPLRRFQTAGDVGSCSSR